MLTARAKGLTERQVLYGHVFRNAMLIVIAGFPGAFIGAFFTGSLLIETIFSLDGLGLLGFDSVIKRDYPVVFATLYIFSLIGPRRQSDLRPHLYLGRSAHRFRDARGLRRSDVARPTHAITARRRRCPRQSRRRRGAFGCRRSTGAAGRISRRNRRGYWSFWIFLVLFVLSLFAEFIANDKPLLVHYKGEILLPGASSTIRKTNSAVFETEADYRDPAIQDEIDDRTAG